MSDPSGNDTPYANIKGFKGLLVQLQDTGKMDATADSIARNIFPNQSYSQAKLYEPNYYFITPAKPDTVKPQEAWNLSNLVQQYPDVIKAWPCFEFNRKPDDDWAGPGCAKHEPKALTKKLWLIKKGPVLPLAISTADLWNTMHYLKPKTFNTGVVIILTKGIGMPGPAHTMVSIPTAHLPPA